MNEYKNRIKQLRMENNLSQRDLAKAINCSQKSIDYWEKGLSDLSSSFLIKLADYFKCSTDYILGRENDLGTINMDFKDKFDFNFSHKDETAFNLYKKLSEQNKLTVGHFIEFIYNKQNN